MRTDLVPYLRTVDERLLVYLDDRRELSPDVVKRLYRYASGLVEGSMTFELVVEDWPDFYDLVPAFVLAYGSPELEALYDRATFAGESPSGRVVPVTDDDRVFLVSLVNELEEHLGAEDR